MKTSTHLKNLITILIALFLIGCVNDASNNSSFKDKPSTDEVLEGRSEVVKFEFSAKQAPYKVPHDVKTLEVLELDLDNWVGKMLGFAGLVQEIHPAYHGKPDIKILLRNPNLGKRYLWVSSLVKAEGLEAGNIIRVLGYLDRVRDDDIALKYNDTGFHLMSICIVNQNLKMGYFLPADVKKCTRWQQGEHPETLGDIKS